MSVQIDGSTGNIIATKADYSGDVSIGGTLTYEDVTNIDSVGLITARNGIKVDDLGVQVGTGATIDGATNTLTFLTNGSERLRVTSDGNVGINSANPTDFLQILPTDGKGITLKTTENHSAQITADCNRSAADNTILAIRGNWNGTGVAAIELTTSDDTSNKDDGNILFKTAASGGNVNQRMQINRNGQILINGAGDVFNGRTGFFNDTGGSGTQLQIEGSIYAYSSMSITRNGSGVSGPVIILAKGRGGTTVASAGDEMGKLSFQGAEGGGDMVEGAKITSEVDGTPGTSDMPGRLIFYTTSDGSSSSSERMRIDSSGRLLVGSPNGSTSQLFQIKGDTGGANNGGTILLQNGVADSSAAAGTGLGGIAFGGATGNQYCRIEGFADAAGGTNDYPGRISFSVTADGGSSPTERIRINRFGGLNVGSSKLGVNTGDGNITVDEGVYISAYDGDYQIRGNSSGSGSATLYIGNSAIQVSSDRRIKENIVDTVVDAAEELKRVRVVDFTWNDPSDMSFNNRNARGTWTGLIAQELIDVFPFAVNAPRVEEDLSIDHDSEKRWLVNQDQLVPVLIKGFQQSLARIETLETQNTAQQAQIDNLLARVTALEG